VVWEENLTIYSATYAYGIAISTTAILITVFFTKVCGTRETLYQFALPPAQWNIPDTALERVIKIRSSQVRPLCSTQVKYNSGKCEEA
jgi:hypothetical protein